MDDFVEGQDDSWTCEIGILDGHRETPITTLKNRIKEFEDGDFAKLTEYIRPHKDRPRLTKTPKDTTTTTASPSDTTTAPISATTSV